MNRPEAISLTAVRRLATLTCCVALLPIGMGSLVTTMKAGMAFADWPSSDGQSMLLYPWFRDFRSNPEKFVEHGHRLAGVLIGCVAIALAVAGWQVGAGWVRRYSAGILVAVIAQGLLGGARVLMDAQVMAMTHSLTGALFFSVCVLFRLLLSPAWSAWLRSCDDRPGLLGSATSIVFPVLVLGQYALGGALRHLHLLRTEHALGAVMVLLIGGAVSSRLVALTHPLLKACGLLIASSLALQFTLGLGAMMARFGLKKIGYVAVVGAPEQALVCSLHTVVGMFLFASSCITSLAVCRLYSAGCLTTVTSEISGTLSPADGRSV
ncbi:MAG: COX15/CtaA family protein [Planctomycetota bacterium]